MVYIALLRAVNVGGTGLLPMRDLQRLCTEAGFQNPRTFIQSGNVVFHSTLPEQAVSELLHQSLHTHLGKPVDVLLRSAPDLEAILHNNPFPCEAPNKVMVHFLPGPPPAAAHGLVGPAGEQVRTGPRELYLFYPEGQGRSKLKLPLPKNTGTARNLNTVARLVAMAGEAS